MRSSFSTSKPTNRRPSRDFRSRSSTLFKLRADMRTLLLIYIAMSFVGATDKIKDYPVQPVPFTDVHLADEFWSPRIETNRTVTIPFAFEQCEKNGRMYNFERAATALRG